MQVRRKQPAFTTEVLMKISLKKNLQIWSGLKLRELLRTMLTKLKELGVKFADSQIWKH